MNASETERLLDYVGWQILRELQENGRISFTELGRRVSLSTPAVTERVRRLEDAGVITGYRATVDPAKVGLPLAAIMRITVPGGRCDRLVAVARTLPEVLQCDRVTGSYSLIMHVAVASVGHLEAVIDHLMPYGEITTSIVLSPVVTHRTLAPASEKVDAEVEERTPTPMRSIEPRH